jgi:hypothetical protein
MKHRTVLRGGTYDRNYQEKFEVLKSECVEKSNVT